MSNDGIKAPAVISLTQSVQQHYSPVHDYTRLSLRDQSFAYATVSEFTWTAQPLGSTKVYSATSSSLLCTIFSLRHAKLVGRPPIARPININDPPETKTTFSAPDSPQEVRLSEIIISRAIELEAELRSESTCSFYPRISNAFCIEASSTVPQPIPRSSATTPGSCSTSASSPPSSLVGDQLASGPTNCILAPGLQPATFGSSPDPSKINIKLVNAKAGDLNQARWLFCTVIRPENASLFTRLVEQRDVREFHIVTTEEDDQVPDEYRLCDPWHMAWRWLARRPAEFIDETTSSYLAAVGLSWAPVPRMIEASWIYELCVYGFGRSRPVFDETEFTLDCSGPLVRNTFVSDTMLCGFEGFLNDVVAFWRGLSWPLDMNENVPAKQELKAFGPLRLKQLASKYCDDRWIVGEVPIASLVKGAWAEVNWRRNWIPYCPNDLTIILPSRLHTVTFEMSGPAGNFVREKVYVNGYATYFTTEKQFRVGISGAGFFLGDCNLFLADIAERTGRQRNSWIFDVTERFTLTANSLEIIFCAAAGANLKAVYDESYARMFDADQFCFGAITDWPRSCFARPDPQRQHQIVFSINDPADPRGRGVYELLQALNKHGGLLYITCDKVTSLLAPSSERTLLIPRLATSGVVGVSRSLARSCIGRVHCDRVSAGIYQKGLLPTLSKGVDAAKLAFVRSVMSDNEEIEVCSMDRNAPRGGADQDQLPIPLPPGTDYTLASLL